MRKIISISEAMWYDSHGTGAVRIFALCDDGTLWVNLSTGVRGFGQTDAGWRLVEGPPGTY